MVKKVVGGGKDVVVQRRCDGGTIHFAIPPEWLPFKEEIHAAAASVAESGMEIVAIDGDQTSLFMKFPGELLEFRVDSGDGGEEIVLIHFFSLLKEN